MYLFVTTSTEVTCLRTNKPFEMTALTWGPHFPIHFSK